MLVAYKIAQSDGVVFPVLSYIYVMIHAIFTLLTLYASSVHGMGKYCLTNKSSGNTLSLKLLMITYVLLCLHFKFNETIIQTYNLIFVFKEKRSLISWSLRPLITNLPFIFLRKGRNFFILLLW